MTRSVRDFRSSRAFDLLAASPLVVFYVFAVAGIAITNAPRLAALARHFRWPDALDIASQVAFLVFLALQVVLFLIRRLPLGRADGLMPRAAALVGANLGFLFLALPRIEMSAAVALCSTTLTLAGTIASIAIAVWLGRGFAIFPQARTLVVKGPYRFVRHPLYLAEQVATFGVMLQFAQPWGLLVALVSLAAQFPRMHYEEQVLRETFPEYRDYAARTPRLIPGVY